MLVRIRVSTVQLLGILLSAYLSARDGHARRTAQDCEPPRIEKGDGILCEWMDCPSPDP
jgi:hypothetical protein